MCPRACPPCLAFSKCPGNTLFKEAFEFPCVHVSPRGWAKFKVNKAPPSLGINKDLLARSTSTVQSALCLIILSLNVKGDTEKYKGNGRHMEYSEYRGYRRNGKRKEKKNT